MSKLKAVNLLLIFLLIGVVIALEWKEIISMIDRIYKEIGLNTPSFLLTILEKESSFAKNLGSNAGSKEKNIKRCVDFCWEITNAVKCNDLNERRKWCEGQYEALEKILNNLGLDINKVPFADDFGMGYTQFQPTTWLMYPELKNKNPWNLEDSLYAAGLKLKKDGINENLERAVYRYNQGGDYFKEYKTIKEDWDYILSGTIFIYDCSSNDFSCALSYIKAKFPECTENDWPIKEKKECLKKVVALRKEEKLAKRENKLKELELTLTYLETKESTLAFIKSPTSFFAKIFNFFSKPETLYQERKTEDTSLFKEEQTTTSQSFKTSPEITSYIEKIYQKGEEEKTQYYEIDRTKEVREIQQEPILKTNNKLLEDLVAILTPKQISTPTPATPTVTTSIDSTDEEKSFIIGGGGSTSVRKDSCEDYKNKTYPNILINEVLFETENNTKDEFIELYNPTEQEINLTCWKLEKYASKQTSTSTPTLTKLIPESKFKDIKIKPFSFLLIAHPSSSVANIADLTYASSYSISKNNTLILRKPNGGVSDLLGYGDDEEKIYQFESDPFLFFESLENKSIQRKNFIDTDNNFKDFWLRNPTPKNSSFSERKREDFIDLTDIEIKDFRVWITSTEDSYYLNLSFTEPTSSVTSTNYSYQLLSSLTPVLNTFTLEDFGNTSSLPIPQFSGQNIELSLEINKCPTTYVSYYFGLYIQDNLDPDNISRITIVYTVLPEDFCNSHEPEGLIQNITSTSTVSTGLVLISEIYIKEGTSSGEFIELYNPNDFDIDLTEWRIERVNKNGKIQVIVPSSKMRGIIPAYSYFLLMNSNTSSEFQINPDFLYSKSYDLAKNNALRLIDKENNIIDEVCWGNVSGCENYLDNPSPGFSFHRKKLANSTTSTLPSENYGNAYDTDNSQNDFLLLQPDPENSSITRPTIKTIEDLQITIEDKKYRFFWTAPALYEKNLSYELRWASTTTDFEEATPLPLELPPFHLLSHNVFELDFCSLNVEYQRNSSLNFYLGILKDNQLLQSVSQLINMIDCKDITSHFELEGLINLTRNKGFIPFKVKKNIFLEEIELLDNNTCTRFRCLPTSTFYSLITEIKKVLSTTTEDEELREIESLIFSTLTFQVIEYGQYNPPSTFYVIYKIPINLNLNQEDRIRIYFRYEESYEDDGVSIFKFRGY